MRLIDADEVLKRWGLKFYAMGGDRLGPNGDDISFYVNGLLNEIQNAPTVETDVEVVAKDAYKQGYTDGWKERFGEPDERPTGEWIEDSYAGIHCSECDYFPLKDVVIKINTDGSKVKSGNYNLTPYCPICGAHMKGKEANND